MKPKTKNRLRIEALRADALNQKKEGIEEEIKDRKRAKKLEKFLFLIRSTEEARKKRLVIENQRIEDKNKAWDELIIKL